MHECPSCQKDLHDTPTALYCPSCGNPLSATATTSTATTSDSSRPLVASPYTQPFLDDDMSTDGDMTQIIRIPPHLRQVRPTTGTPEQTEPTPAPPETQKAPVSHNGSLNPTSSTAIISPASSADYAASNGHTGPVDPVSFDDPYAQKKRDLFEQSTTLMASLEKLLPFVHESDRAGHQTLFASIQAKAPLPGDPNWSHIAGALGPYGNYMHQHSLSAEQTQIVWQALLWAVFYECCYRRKYLTKRIQQLLRFFLGCAKDTAFIESVQKDLYELSSYLNPSSLKKLIEAIEQLSPPPANLLEHLSQQHAKAMEKAFDSAKQSKQTPSPPKQTEQSSQTPSTSKQIEQPKQTPNPPQQAEQESLATSPTQQAEQPSLTFSMSNQAEQTSQADSPTQQVEQPSLVSSLTQQVEQPSLTFSMSNQAEQTSQADSPTQQVEQPSLVSSLTQQVEQSGKVPSPPQQAEQSSQARSTPKEEAQAKKSVSNKDLTQKQKPALPSLAPDEENPKPMLTDKTSKNDVSPVERKKLSFLSSEQNEEIFASLQADDLQAINRILRNARQPLLETLLQELTTSATTQYQPPRRSIRLGRKQADSFIEALRMLDSELVSERLAALHLFEQGGRDIHPNIAPLAHEWMLYARAKIQGGSRAVDEWEHKFQRDEASWEEILNLALFYQRNGFPEESLRVLGPKLGQLLAPVVHLRFALVCALKLLLESKRAGTAAQEGALRFLLAHLELYPHPLNFLAWLLLAHETYRHIHPRLQWQKLRTFQELIEHLPNIPDPQIEISEIQVTELKRVLVDKAHCENAWLLWLNDYANRHRHKYQIWARLAKTNEDMGRLKAAERVLQYLVESQYENDFVRYPEGIPSSQAGPLRSKLENLFEFYQRHNLKQESEEAFHFCYSFMRYLWDSHDLANQKLIALTRPYLEARQMQDTPTMLLRHEGSTRELGKTFTIPLEQVKQGQRVGIFVDYENIAVFIPQGVDAEQVGQALVHHATQLGEVVCRYASASPQNLSKPADVRAGLEAAGFKVRFPRLQFGPSKKNLADFVLLECISDAQANLKPDIYLIVSGDGDYSERICSLLDAGHTVRVIASTKSQHLSNKYRKLEQQRAQDRHAAGHPESDFFIDNLEEIL
jgi:hypothetical protein